MSIRDVRPDEIDRYDKEQEEKRKKDAALQDVLRSKQLPEPNIGAVVCKNCGEKGHTFAQCFSLAKKGQYELVDSDDEERMIREATAAAIAKAKYVKMI